MTTATKGVYNSTVKNYHDLNHYLVLDPSNPESLKSITPIPTGTTLGLPINSSEKYGKSIPVEIIPFPCNCGIDLGPFLRIYSSCYLKEKIESQSNILDFNEFLKKYELDTLYKNYFNDCCRLTLLAPYLNNVISIDKNSYVVNTEEKNNSSFYEFKI